jgi:hypothetical protein
MKQVLRIADAGCPPIDRRRGDPDCLQPRDPCPVASDAAIVANHRPRTEAHGVEHGRHAAMRTRHHHGAGMVRPQARQAVEQDDTVRHVRQPP